MAITCRFAEELERFKIEAGNCVVCGRNLLRQSSYTDGAGRVCVGYA